MAKSRVKTVEEELIETPYGIDPKAASSAIDEYLKEEDGVTSPSSVVIDKTNEAVEAIRKSIEKLIKPKWNASESNRLLDCSTLSDRYSLKDIKTALIPYVRKGWFVTVTLPDMDRRSVMLTYEANTEFVTTGKWGNSEQNRDIYIRLYPNQPVRTPYVGKIFDPAKLFGPIGISLSLGLAVAVGIFVAPLFSITGIILATAIAFFIATYSGGYASMKMKSGAKKKLGPLLFIDDIREYKTTHKTVTRDNRIQEALQSRVLETEEDW